MQSTRVSHSAFHTAPLGNPVENWHGFYTRVTLLTTRFRGQAIFRFERREWVG